MYSYIIGEIKLIEKDYVVLEANNIGYKLHMPQVDIDQLNINDSHKIYTEFVVRDDGVYLYGFMSQEEHKLFLSLTSVSSVGPKAGLSILSVLSDYEVKKAIVTNDINALTKAPGIGRKTASRIILELSDKLDLQELIEPKKEEIKKSNLNENYQFALEALIKLDYPKSQAQKVLEEIDVENTPLSDIVRLALKKI